MLVDGSNQRRSIRALKLFECCDFLELHIVYRLLYKPLTCIFNSNRIHLCFGDTNCRNAIPKNSVGQRRYGFIVHSDCL